MKQRRQCLFLLFFAFLCLVLRYVLLCSNLFQLVEMQDFWVDTKCKLRFKFKRKFKMKKERKSNQIAVFIFIFFLFEKFKLNNSETRASKKESTEWGKLFMILFQTKNVDVFWFEWWIWKQKRKNTNDREREVPGKSSFGYEMPNKTTKMPSMMPKALQAISEYLMQQMRECCSDTLMIDIFLRCILTLVKLSSSLLDLDRKPQATNTSWTGQPN